jgi:hypothetical protein
VDSSKIWSSDYNATLTVRVLNPYFDALDGSGDVTDLDAPLVYTSSQLDSMMSFNISDVLTNVSTGFWLNQRTLRVVPSLSNNTVFFQGMINTLALTRLRPIPTIIGNYASTYSPVLVAA